MTRLTFSLDTWFQKERAQEHNLNYAITDGEEKITSLCSLRLIDVMH